MGNENPYFDKLVGIPNEEKYLEDKFHEVAIGYVGGKGEQKIEDFEIEPSEKDQEILSLASKTVNQFAGEYGRSQLMADELLKSHIHVLSSGGTEQYTEGRLAGGSYSPKGASIIIDRTPSDIDFALRAFHELMHLRSYRALQIIRGDEAGSTRLEAYRSGFDVTSRDGTVRYFTDFEEAVVGLLEKRFLDEVMVMHPLFQDELQEKLSKKEDIVVGRKEERAKLGALIDEIFAINPTQFSSRKQIEDLFIDAQINGSLLPVARVIEKSFGKGSFRSLGEETGSSIEKEK